MDPQDADLSDVLYTETIASTSSEFALVVDFTRSFQTKWLTLARRLRLSMEHPAPDRGNEIANRLTAKNYIKVLHMTFMTFCSTHFQQDCMIYKCRVEG